MLYGPGILVREPGALFCHVECLETRGTVAGRSLHGMSLVVVVFLGRILVEELILYVEISWSCWIACGNTVVLVECGNTTVFCTRS